ncbi:hypothetical protein PLICRDRAFT_684824 [Plicaturopsis crispa FD-325 SS-3]|uniref:Unplaced genomic scaffold PLICRscaffold_58, whole genome shotgun sequence n=1 Tax=Plicaturopsis crispa FD-325 SS-3 TaxID=944288 RepID=A0A0C9SJZ7_PLICR|nr:hypothetical protein PLICRDRAFT_684824 [Plicaturopsis crispa FD-325 SS-3]
MPSSLEIVIDGATRRFRATAKVVTCEVCEGADHIVCPWGIVIPALLRPSVRSEEGIREMCYPLTRAKDMRIGPGAFFSRRIELECYEDWIEYMQEEQESEDDQLQWQVRLGV